MFNGQEIATLLWIAKELKLFIAAANLFQDAEEREAATRLCENLTGHDATPVLWMLMYEHFDPWAEPVSERKRGGNECQCLLLIDANF
jgi:hypothetical protein